MTRFGPRPIGTTNVAVSSLGFGGAAIGNLYAETGDEEVRECLHAAYDAGVRYFDTAPMYGHGLSEHRIGEALRQKPRDSFVLSTKVGRMLRPVPAEAVGESIFPGCLPFACIFDYSYDAVMRSIEDSLQRLGFNRIDIVLLHDVEAATHGAEQADIYFSQAMAGGYRALDKLRSEGTIGAIGCGGNEWQAAERLAHAGDFDCFLLAGRYTLLEQTSLDSFLPYCEARNISVIIGGPYNTGILATGAVPGAYFDYAPAGPEVLDRVSRIEAICRDHDVPLAAAALQFPLHHSAVASVIPGSRSVGELRRNLDNMAVAIPDGLWGDLKSAGFLREDAPTP
jgi:D-threo-aldose 1-dehydrogenase